MTSSPAGSLRRVSRATVGPRSSSHVSVSPPAGAEDLLRDALPPTFRCLRLLPSRLISSASSGSRTEHSWSVARHEYSGMIRPFATVHSSLTFCGHTSLPVRLQGPAVRSARAGPACRTSGTTEARHRWRRASITGVRIARLMARGSRLVHALVPLPIGPRDSGPRPDFLVVITTAGKLTESPRPPQADVPAVDEAPRVVPGRRVEGKGRGSPRGRSEGWNACPPGRCLPGCRAASRRRSRNERDRSGAPARPHRVAERTPEELHRALGPALDRVSAENARAYFRHCRYYYSVIP